MTKWDQNNQIDQMSTLTERQAHTTEGILFIGEKKTKHWYRPSADIAFIIIKAQ